MAKLISINKEDSNFQIKVSLCMNIRSKLFHYLCYGSWAAASGYPRSHNTTQSQMSPAAFLWQIMIKIPHLHSQLRPGPGQRGIISWKNSFYTEILRQIFWHDLDLAPTWAEYKIFWKCKKSVLRIQGGAILLNPTLTQKLMLLRLHADQACWHILSYILSHLDTSYFLALCMIFHTHFYLLKISPISDYNSHLNHFTLARLVFVSN